MGCEGWGVGGRKGVDRGEAGGGGWGGWVGGGGGGGGGGAGGRAVVTAVAVPSAAVVVLQAFGTGGRAAR